VGITEDRGRYYWVKRVPRRYVGLVLGADGQPIRQVRQALHTDSRAEAEMKAAQVEAARIAEWEALAAGDGTNARKHYLAAHKLAQARGFPYRPMSTLTDGDVFSLASRVLSLAESVTLKASPAATEAVLGAVPEVTPDLNEVLADYYELTKTRHLQKSDAQRHRWKLPRDRAVRNFLEVVAPRNSRGKPVAQPVNQIVRADAIKFRNWWSARVEGGMKIESANKDLGHLAEIFGTWSELTDTPLSNPFAKLRLEGKDERYTPAFSREWIKTKLLAPGALASMNDEASDVCG